MAEIKSTLELALERTRGLSISEKEKAEIKQREILRKASGLSLRYAEQHLPLQEVLRELDRMDLEMRHQVRETIVSQWIDALSVSGENEKLLEGIASLKGRTLDRLHEKLHRLADEYRTRKREREDELRGKQIEGLKQKGIGGSAVVPAVEGSPAWIAALEALDGLFEPRLEEVKATLRSL